MHRNNSNRSRAGWTRGFMALFAMLAMGLGLTARRAEAAPFAYVSNYGLHGEGSTVSVIDTATNTVVATVTVGSGPIGVAVTPDGKQVYVTNQGSGHSNTVSVIDAATNTVVATVTVGNAPNAVAVTPDGAHAYVTDDSGSAPGHVSVIDTATNTVSAGVTVGTAPFDVAVTPDGAHAYVTNEGSGTVSVIDTATNTVGSTVTVGGLPFHVAISPNGKHVYVTQGYTTLTAGTVAVIDTATNTVTATVTVGPEPNALSALAVAPDGKHVYLTNDGSVSMIDTATNSVVGTPIPVESPIWVAFTPDGKHAYVPNAVSAGTVSVIDTATNTVVGTPIPVGSGPFVVAIVRPPACIPFLAFNAKLGIDLEHKPNKDHFELLSSFTLGSASNGINPATEAVTLQVGTFTTTIPPGSFKEIGGIFFFRGVIGGVRLEALIAPTSSLRYALVAAAQDANLTGTVNPVPVTLTIGDDCGTASVQALISH
jgi:YVTN family beta-propeller protein